MRLELPLQRELDFTLVIGHRAGDGCAAYDIYLIAGKRKVRRVRDIEEFGSKLETLPLRQPKVLEDTHIKINKLRTPQVTVTAIAEDVSVLLTGSEGWSGEHRLIVEALQGLLAVTTQQLLAGQVEGEVIGVMDPVRPVAVTPCVAQVTGKVGGIGLTALQGGNSGHLPPAQQQIGCASRGGQEPLALAERQLVQITNHKAVADVGGCRALFNRHIVGILNVPGVTSVGVT